MIDIMLWEGDPPGVYKNDLHHCRKRARWDLCDKTLLGCSDYYEAGREAKASGWTGFILSSPHRCIDICDQCSLKPLTEIMKSIR